MFSMEVTRLIERCRQGDADALGVLYKAYTPKMRGVCRRYVSDEQTISDVLHDSFLIIFTSFDKLRDDRKAEAWMMSITRNVASKYKDHLAKMTFVSQEEAEHLQTSEGESEVRGVPLEDVLQFVNRLPEGYGQVFRLSVFEGMSHREAAFVIVTIGTGKEDAAHDDAAVLGSRTYVATCSYHVLPIQERGHCRQGREASCG